MEKYQIKDVIFGLRDEYLKIENELQSINNMIQLPSSRDKLNYSIFRDEEKNIIDLKLSLYRKQSILLSLIQKLGQNVSSEYDRRILIHKLYDNGEHGLIIGDERNIKLPFDCNDIFHSVDKILDSKLVNNTPHVFAYKEKFVDRMDIKREVNVTALGLNVKSTELKEDELSVPSEFIAYIIDGDYVKYSSYHDLAMSPSIERCLNSEFDGSLLNDTEKKIIEKSNIRNKRVTVEDISMFDETTDLTVEDTHDEIILRVK